MFIYNLATRQDTQTMCSQEGDFQNYSIDIKMRKL